MKEKSKFCQYYYRDMALETFPDARLALPLRKYWWSVKRHVWWASVLGIQGSVSRFARNHFVVSNIRKKETPNRIVGSEILNLKPEEWVEVRSAKEIFATLDEKGKLRGLTFTAEMTKFCGRKFKVYKKLDKIILEATGELRKMRTPTVLLEGVFCDGKAHGGCDRSCFCFWREEWLKRASTLNQSNQRP